MRILIAAVTAGILSSTALAAEPVPVQPEFHSLNADAAAPKRRLPGSHKSAAVSGAGRSVVERMRMCFRSAAARRKSGTDL